jgi:hypothetical protein
MAAVAMENVMMYLEHALVMKVSRVLIAVRKWRC